MVVGGATGVGQRVCLILSEHAEVQQASMPSARTPLTIVSTRSNFAFGGVAPGRAHAEPRRACARALRAASRARRRSSGRRTCRSVVRRLRAVGAVFRAAAALDVERAALDFVLP